MSNIELTKPHVVLGHYETEELAKEAAHDVIRSGGGLASGYGLYLTGDAQSGYDVVRFYHGDIMAGFKEW